MPRRPAAGRVCIYCIGAGLEHWTDRTAHSHSDSLDRDTSAHAHRTHCGRLLQLTRAAEEAAIKRTLEHGVCCTAPEASESGMARPDRKRTRQNETILWTRRKICAPPDNSIHRRFSCKRQGPYQVGTYQLETSMKY